MKLGELVLEVAVSGGSKAGSALTNLGRAFSATAKAAAVVGVSMAGVVAAVKWAGGVGRDMMQFHRATGLSIDSLQRWQVIGSRFGVTAEEIQSSFENIQSTIQRMKMGEGAPKALSIFGIDPKDDPSKILEKIRVGLKKVSPERMPEAQYFLESLGITPRMLQMLKGATFGPESVSSRLFPNIRTYQELDRLFGEFDQLLFIAKRIGMELVLKIGKPLFPIFEKLINQVGNFLLGLDQKSIFQFFESIKNFFIGIYKAFTSKQFWTDIFNDLITSIKDLMNLLKEAFISTGVVAPKTAEDWEKEGAVSKFFLQPGKGILMPEMITPRITDAERKAMRTQERSKENESQSRSSQENLIKQITNNFNINGDNKTSKDIADEIMKLQNRSYSDSWGQRRSIPLTK